MAAWLAEGRAPFYARAWESVFSMDAEGIAAFLDAATEEATAMRHATPFAGAVDARHRWRIRKETREQSAGR